MITKHEMSLTINDAEYAIGNINDIVNLFKNADGEIIVKIRLGHLRQLANCYPALNKIVNDPDFTCKE